MEALDNLKEWQKYLVSAVITGILGFLFYLLLHYNLLEYFLYLVLYLLVTFLVKLLVFDLIIENVANSIQFKRELKELEESLKNRNK